MKKVVLSLVAGILIGVSGFAVAGHFMNCKCGTLCACNPCHCNK